MPGVILENWKCKVLFIFTYYVKRSILRSGVDNECLVADIIVDQLGRHRPAALSKGSIKSDRLHFFLPQYFSSCVILLVSLTQQWLCILCVEPGYSPQPKLTLIITSVWVTWHLPASNKPDLPQIINRGGKIWSLLIHHQCESYYRRGKL